MVTANKPYRVLVVDDHAVVRRGIRTLIESHSEIQVCAEASNGHEALKLLDAEKPDMVLLDITMPGMDGVEVTRTIRGVSPSTEVLILSMHSCPKVARAAMQAGANAYVVKSDADQELLDAIQSVRQRRKYLTSQLAGALVDAFVNLESDEESSDDALLASPLSPREIEVLKALAAGDGNKQVAASLGVSTRTVESHRSRIMHKMNFSSLSDLVRFALRRGYIEM
jgi:DNA-binding NarL/FixJ family response regulator